MNKMQKIIFLISIALIGAGVLGVSETLAQNDNLVVEFEPDPLFQNTNFLPGQNVVGTARVVNNSGQPQRITTEAINYPGFPNPNNVPTSDLSRALSIIIREKGGNDLYGGLSPTGEKTLFNFYQNGETYLSDISSGAGGIKEYEFKINFPSEKENEWQNATTTFDILIGFQGVEGDATGGGGGGGSGGGGGGGGGLFPPGLTIQNESVATTTAISVTITWATSYFSTSQVIYDTVPGKFDLSAGSPNYGYAYSKEGDNSGLEKVTGHSVTITGLTPGTVYYYRCVSHGSLAISQEHSFATIEETPKEEIFEERINSEGISSGGETVLIQPEEKAEEKEITSEKIQQPLPEISVVERPNFLLAAISNFITLGIENNIIAIAVVFVIVLIIYLMISAYFAKKKNQFSE